MPDQVLATLLIILLAILIVSILFRALHFPVILAYIVVGIITGPEVLGLVKDLNLISYLAEFGVILLMFTVGLDFSLDKLASLRYTVFVLGGMQIGFTILIMMTLAAFLGMDFNASMTIAAILSMSSTALVMKQLSAQSEIHSQHGLNALGILLFQDMAVIPIMIVVASLGSSSHNLFLLSLFNALLRGIAAIFIVLILGRWLVRPLFHFISGTKIKELFTLTVLFVSLGAAWITNSLGMTYALGAFLSGIMLAETEFTVQIKNEIRPFRDAFLGLFFVSIGMLANLKIWAVAWFWIVLSLIGLMIGKACIITLISLFSRYNVNCSIRTGLVLAQGGEFGFAVLALAVDRNLIPDDYAQVVLAALLISFALAPIIISSNQEISKYFARFLKPYAYFFVKETSK